MSFTRRSQERIAASVKWTERQLVPLAHKRLKRRGGGVSGGSAARTTTIISGFDSATATAGKGTIQPYILDTATDQLSAIGSEVEAFNLDLGIGNGVWVYYDVDAQGNYWVEKMESADYGSVAKTTTPISAFADPKAGKGTIELYRLNPVDDNLIATGTFATGFNLEDAILSGEWVYYDVDVDGFYWVEPLGGTPTATGVGIYRANAYEAFDGDTATYLADITSVIQPGAFNVSDQVTVTNEYAEAGEPLDKLLLVEWYDDPTMKLLAMNVERSFKNVYVPSVSVVDDSGGKALRFGLEKSWSHYKAIATTDDLALAKTVVIEDSDDPVPATWQGREIYHVFQGDVVASDLTTADVVESIDWTTTPGTINVKRDQLTVLKKTALPDAPFVTTQQTVVTEMDFNVGGNIVWYKDKVFVIGTDTAPDGSVGTEVCP